MDGYDGLNPTTEGRPCPLRLADPCPGTHAGCALWRMQHVEFEGRHRVIGNCTLVLLMEASARSINEQVATTAAVESSRNQTVIGLAALLSYKASETAVLGLRAVSKDEEG
jgi:hypothetical protein